MLSGVKPVREGNARLKCVYFPFTEVQELCLGFFCFMGSMSFDGLIFLAGKGEYRENIGKTEC